MPEPQFEVCYRTNPCYFDNELASCSKLGYSVLKPCLAWNRYSVVKMGDYKSLGLSFRVAFAKLPKGRKGRLLSPLRDDTNAS